jgi:secreted PhoX family phosphatase
VTWIDLDDVESPEDDLRFRGFASGAARFARGEGMWYGRGAIYFACTNGGSEKKGQIWKYTPSPDEGKPEESREPGRLELFVEPNDGTLVENADNLTMAPWGDLIVCEDGSEQQFLVGVTPEGEIYKFARNAMNTSELAGATYSPDGSTLFVNIQSPGITLAITGPWMV